MNIRILIAAIVSIFVWPRASWANSLQASCALNGGDLIEEWTCPASGALRKGPFCMIKNSLGMDLVFNGCTGVKGEYSELFFRACTLHDFCYHNEPAVSGKTKEECDKLLLTHALELCSQQPDHKKRCRTAAYSFYYAVKVGGGKSWNCSKNAVVYPTSMDDSL